MKLKLSVTSVTFMLNMLMILGLVMMLIMMLILTDLPVRKSVFLVMSINVSVYVFVIVTVF